MPRKYVRQKHPNPITRNKVITAITAKVRFHQFYDFLVMFCKEVRLLFINEKGTRVKFRLSVSY